MNQHSNFHGAPMIMRAADINAGIEAACPQIGAFLPSGGCEFPSNEHFYQALASDSLETFLAFTTSGRFGRLDVTFFELLLVEKLLPVKKKVKGAPATAKEIRATAVDKVKYWKPKGNVGIVAKMVSTMDANMRARLFAPLVFDYDRLDTLSEEHQRLVWRAIHLRKYETHAKLRESLLATGSAYLLEFVRGAERVERQSKGATVEKWGGLINEQGEIFGCNYMGRFLMAARHDLAVKYRQ